MHSSVQSVFPLKHANSTYDSSIYLRIFNKVFRDITSFRELYALHIQLSLWLDECCGVIVLFVIFVLGKSYLCPKMLM